KSIAQWYRRYLRIRRNGTARFESYFNNTRCKSQSDFSNRAVQTILRDRTNEIDEGDRGDGPGCGNGRDEVGGAPRAAGSDKRCHRSDSCIGIRPDGADVALDLDRSPRP